MPLVVLIECNISQERALHFIDSQQGDIVLSEGVQMVKTDDLPTGRSLDDTPLSNDLETRENEVDMLLVDRVARFFGTHTLQFKMPKDSVEEIQRSLDEGKDFFKTVNFRKK